MAFYWRDAVHVFIMLSQLCLSITLRYNGKTVKRMVNLSRLIASELNGVPMESGVLPRMTRRKVSKSLPGASTV